jgi:hypothetical protein
MPAATHRDGTGTLIERHLPHFDVRERHALRIQAAPEAVLAAARSLNLGDSPLCRALFRLRGMPRRALGMEGMRSLGFVLLEEREGRGFVLGLIGRFWSPRGGLLRFEPPAFAAFARPGYARAAWSFEAEEDGEGTLLTTETRVHCADPRGRRLFRLYWLVVRPFSGLIRREALRLVRRRAEAAGGEEARA